MPRPLFKATLVFAVLLSAPAFASTEPTAHQGKPNIIFIMADDVGYGEFGCYGATAVKTPNIDKLAKQGLRFKNGYCTSATCTPSRYSFITGEYAFRKKGTGVLPGDAALIVEPGRSTLPTTLQKAGYKTAVVGKWHLGLGTKETPVNWNSEIKPGPLEVGFDYSFIMAATGDRAPCVYVENHKVVGLVSEDPIHVNYKEAYPGEPTGEINRTALRMDWSHGHNNAVINGIGRIGYMKGGKAALWKDEDMADVFTKQALEFIQHEKEHPFFLYFATHDIHVPRVPNPRFVGSTTMGARGDAVVEFDDSVGRIMQKLEQLHLAENTLVILSSDNGPVLDDGYQDQANEKLGDHKPAGPLRGGKYSLFEGGCKVPFIVSWPNRVKAGVSDAIVSQVDMAASLSALTGQNADLETMPDSMNILPALLGDSATGRNHVVEYTQRVAIREGKWKFIPQGPLREHLGPWIDFPVPPEGLLFDLETDPGETRNLVTENAKVVLDLKRRLNEIVGTKSTVNSKFLQ